MNILKSKICYKNNNRYYLKGKICYENLKNYYLKSKFKFSYKKSPQYENILKSILICESNWKYYK